MTANNNTTHGRDDLKSAIRKRMVQVVFQLFFMSAIIFLSAGALNWPAAWYLVGVQVGLLIFNVLYLLPRNPEMVAERSQIKEGTKNWDRVLTSAAGLAGLANLVVVGLDWRFNWSPDYALWISILAFICFALGNLLFSWAMVSNKFFATSVRLQLERDHQVESGGPYRFVRHPGYVGYNLFTLTMPLALGSIWGLIPAGLVVMILVIRTGLEDRTLQDELPGYREYARRVRYRLLPGVW